MEDLVYWVSTAPYATDSHKVEPISEIFVDVFGEIFGHLFDSWTGTCFGLENMEDPKLLDSVQRGILVRELEYYLMGTRLRRAWLCLE
jgi:hypothetical protein